MKNILEVKNLTIEADKTLVNGVGFVIQPGEIVGIVGESGSGKSMTALSLMSLLPKDVRRTGGEVNFKDSTKAPAPGTDIAMIFQEPMTSLNPVLRIQTQLEEMLLLHEKELNQAERHKRLVKMLEEVELSEPVLRKYPHELSGGMRQRVMIAMAMMCHPEVLIADEPTTALDARVQEQILELITKLCREYHTAVLFISHDINLVHRFCHHVLVMRQGEIVERGDAHKVFHHPEHPYTKELLAALPKPKDKTPENAAQVVLEVEDLHASYGSQEILKGISFHLQKGEILGIMGDSGCGKSTLSHTITGLHKEYTGEIHRLGHRLGMVFQDPYSSLNPAKTVGWLLEEPLKIQGIKDKHERRQRAGEMLGAVGFSEEYLKRHVRQLSGGQRQRIAIAMALMTRPEIVILDEPVSAIDVTIQDKICRLLLSCKEKFGLSYIFISHDQEVMKMMCDRILQMKEGMLYDY